MEYQFDPVKRTFMTPVNAFLIEDLVLADWLRDKVEKKDPQTIAAYGTLLDHHNRVLTIEEYNAHQPRMFSGYDEIGQYLMMERLGLTGDQYEVLKMLVENPDALKCLAEGRMRYQIADNMCGFNIM